MTIILGLKSFFIHLCKATENVFFAIVAVLAYCIGYPAKEGILIATLVLFVTDIVSKFYALSVQNKGLINAFKLKKLSSRSFWNGFISKIIGYFIILTIANFAVITPEFSIIGGVVSTICYIGLFTYECISNLENMRDANWSFAVPLLNIFKSKQNKFFKEQIENEEPKVTSETTEESNTDESAQG